MNYAQIDQLTNDLAFQGRVRACCTQEAETFQADQRPPISALADDVLRTGGPAYNFVRLIAAAPGLVADELPGTGGPNPAQVPDEVVLAQVQHHWPTVAALFYDSNGNRKEV